MLYQLSYLGAEPRTGRARVIEAPCRAVQNAAISGNSLSGGVVLRGVAGLCVLLAVFFHRDGIDTGEPTMQVHIGATAGTERLVALHRELSAERAWLAGGEAGCVHDQEIRGLRNISK
jgi:hypothetical protein